MFFFIYNRKHAFIIPCVVQNFKGVIFKWEKTAEVHWYNKFHGFDLYNEYRWYNKNELYSPYIKPQ